MQQESRFCEFCSKRCIVYGVDPEAKCVRAVCKLYLNRVRIEPVTP
jgi:hypothetical protein